jgi:predicted transcriptional regulator YdeE
MWSLILAMVCITTMGCNESQQAAPTAKASTETKMLGQMKYNIVERDSFTVMGISTRITKAQDSNATYEKIWNDFEPYKDQVRPLSTNWRYCGVRFPTKEKGVIDYIAGMAVRDDATSPDPNLVTRKVPAARYAVFQCPAQAVEQTYQQIFNQWLPGSRYVFDKNAYIYELYLPRGQANRIAIIHVPIINK